MNKWAYQERRIRGLLQRTGVALFSAAVITVTITGISIVLDRQNSNSYTQRLHEDANHTTFFLQQRIAGRIKEDQSTGTNIARSFAVDPDQASTLVRGHVQSVLASNPHIGSIGISPGLRLSQSFPENIDQDEIGRTLAERFPSLEVQTRHVENNLRKGRPALLTADDGMIISFTPIMASTVDQRSKLWGAVEMEMPRDNFFNAAGFTRLSNDSFYELAGMRIAIRDVSGRGNGMAPIYIYGDPAIAGEQPAIRRIPFEGGALEVMAIPTGGWDIPWSRAAAFRVILVLAGLAIVIPVFGTSLLISERNRNIETLKGREAKLLDLSQRFNLAMDSSNIGIWEMQDDSDDIYLDERAAQLHGEMPMEIMTGLDAWLERVVPEDREMVSAHFRDYKLTGCTYKVTYRIRLGDGSLRWIRSVGARYESADTTTRTTGILWDVTSDELLTQTLREAKEVSEIKNAELELALQELSSREQDLEDLSRKLDMALESYHCGIWEANLETGEELWDARMCQLYGLPTDHNKVTFSQWMDFIQPEDQQKAQENKDRFASGQTTEPLILRVTIPTGETRYIRSVGQLRTGREGTRKVIGLAVDVTEDALLTAALKTAKEEADAKNAELELTKSRIEHNALHDPLTGLGNRRKLDVELERLSTESKEQDVRFSILHLDLDRFKQINDTLGHAAGDAVLIHVAKVLRESIRDCSGVTASDVVARIGGDEFVILLPGYDERHQLTDLADRIVQEIRQPVDIDGFPCRCGVSIGIAQASGRSVDARKMLINADIALYRAKRMGRNRYEFFTENLQAEIINTKRIADEILAGIENDEFVTWYQPQFCARTMKLTGAEALVRWNHPVHGIITPDRFLGIAEELNVVSTIDQMVMHTALKDRMRWAAMGINVPKVSVNVSLRRLHDDALIESLKGLSIAPGELCFELIESIFLDDREAIADLNLEQIKALGIDIEIDDFGTGHTSIVSLLKLKPKRLKIDRQLVMPILDSPQERALVRSIIDIARSLGVETVAEGVETFEHARILGDLGCDMLQGYAFSKPLSFENFARRHVETGWKFAA